MAFATAYGDDNQPQRGSCADFTPTVTLPLNREGTAVTPIFITMTAIERFLWSASGWKIAKARRSPAGPERWASECVSTLDDFTFRCYGTVAVPPLVLCLPAFMVAFIFPPAKVECGGERNRLLKWDRVYPSLFPRLSTCRTLTLAVSLSVQRPALRYLLSFQVFTVRRATGSRQSWVAGSRSESPVPWIPACT